jgi:hypothetical protein
MKPGEDISQSSMFVIGVLECRWHHRTCGRLRTLSARVMRRGNRVRVA